MIPPPVVAIYRDHLLHYSETFIAAQARALRQFRPLLVGARYVDGLSLEQLPTLVVNTGGCLGVVREVGFKCAGLAPHFLHDLRAMSPVLMHAHFGPDGCRAMALQRRLGIPLIVTFHGSDATTNQEQLRHGPLYQRQFFSHRQELYQRAHMFICVSNFIRDELLRNGGPTEKVLVHYIGIDVTQFIPDRTVPREPIVLFVGRLVEKKGCAYLIRAMSEVCRDVPEAELVIIGDGPLRPELETIARGTVRKCRFLGAQSPAAVRGWMNRATVFSVPSVRARSGDAEGFGMVFAEAQAMGLPVGSFSSGGIPEAVEDGRTGLLAAEGDTEALANNIRALLTNRNMWRQFSNAGVRRARELFDINKQTATLEEIYRSVLREYSALPQRTRVEVRAMSTAQGLRWAKSAKVLAQSRQPRVSIIQRVLPRYRIDFFNSLHQALAGLGVHLDLLYGGDRHPEIQWATHTVNHSLAIGKWQLIWQTLPASIFDSDLIVMSHENKLISNYWLLSMARLRRFKVAFWGHGTDFQGYPWSICNRFRRLYSNRVDWWFAYTERVAEMLESAGFPSSRITVVENAIDTNQSCQLSDAAAPNAFDPHRQRLGIRGGPVAVFCGAMNKDKQLEFLLSSCSEVRKRIPDFHLVLIGQGPEQHLVSDFAQSNEWAHYVGAKYATDLVPYFTMATVALMPAAVGLGILTAFSFGLPMVSVSGFRHGPEIDYLHNGENGILTGSSAAEYADVVALLLRSVPLQNRLRRGSLDTAARYTLENMVARFGRGVLQALAVGEMDSTARQQQLIKPGCSSREIIEKT